MALFNLTRWPTVLVFLFAGGIAASFAFVTANLFTQAMASLDFIQEFRLEAVRHGALKQVLELVVWGALAQSCWLLFKIAEQVMEDRYLDWAERTKQRAKQRKKPD